MRVSRTLEHVVYAAGLVLAPVSSMIATWWASATRKAPFCLKGVALVLTARESPEHEIFLFWGSFALRSRGTALAGCATWVLLVIIIIITCNNKTTTDIEIIISGIMTTIPTSAEARRSMPSSIQPNCSTEASAHIYATGSSFPRAARRLSTWNSSYYTLETLKKCFPD